MDELLRLEGVQRMLELMQNHSISGPDAASDRFLAGFLLFMMSSALFQGALCWKVKQGNKEIQFKGTNKQNEDNTNAFHPSIRRYTMGDMPLVGLKAMERAKSTLEDFCRSYFMFHAMDVHKPESLFKFLPILTFVESYIYQLDGLNEESLHPSNESRFSSQTNLRDVYDPCNLESFEMESFHLLSVLQTDPFRPLRLVLENKGLMTERIDKEFRNGVEYWTLERSLCNALLNRTEISVDDAIRALQYKSFDYRVLNLLLYGLSNQEVNGCHWDFLSISEFLVEISDDLFDYEEDVLNNNFNILRMFVKVYGPSNAPSMMAKCIVEAEEQYQCLLNQLDPSLASAYQKRCEEAVKEGGKVSAHSLGSWSIPRIISDEEVYRLQLQGSI